MRLFNSLTNKKEVFEPLKKGEVSIYVCGPTVYNYAHIGNTRPMIVFDVLRRVFEYLDYQVTFVSNYTDVDDKIIAVAKKEGLSEKQITDKYIEAYNQIRHDLNLLSPTYTPRVTNTMDSIIAYIADLIEQGYAYTAEGDVYFKVSKIKEYGQLSGIQMGDLLAGASERVEENTKKKEATDFVLWKKTDDGIRFDSPWSKGRPGWHTECVVMINNIFENGKIDIHGGGQDLKFPHHENEIAQSMACSHHPIAQIWMHNQMINIDNEKMSKSKGNVLWAKDIISEWGSNVTKWLMLSSHYRNPLNFTDAVLETVKKEIAKVDNIVKQVSLYLQVENVKKQAYNSEEVNTMVEALQDDLNTSLALTNILNQVKKLNQLFRAKDKDTKEMAIAFATLMKMTEVIGFDFTPKTLTTEEIGLYHLWLEAKSNKDYEKADQYRSELLEKGIL